MSSTPSYCSALSAMSDHKKSTFCYRYLSKVNGIKFETIDALIASDYDSAPTLLAMDLDMDLDHLPDVSMGQKSLLRKTLREFREHNANQLAIAKDQHRELTRQLLDGTGDGDDHHIDGHKERSNNDLVKRLFCNLDDVSNSSVSVSNSAPELTDDVMEEIEDRIVSIEASPLHENETPLLDVSRLPDSYKSNQDFGQWLEKSTKFISNTQPKIFLSPIKQSSILTKKKTSNGYKTQKKRSSIGGKSDPKKKKQNKRKTSIEDNKKTSNKTNKKSSIKINKKRPIKRFHSESESPKKSSNEGNGSQRDGRSDEQIVCAVCNDTTHVKEWRSCLLCNACQIFMSRVRRGETTIGSCVDETGSCTVDQFTRKRCKYCRYMASISAGVILSQPVDSYQIMNDIEMDVQCEQLVPSVSPGMASVICGRTPTDTDSPTT